MDADIEQLVRSVEKLFRAERKPFRVDKRMEAEDRTNAMLRTIWPLMVLELRGKAGRGRR